MAAFVFQSSILWNTYEPLPVYLEAYSEPCQTPKMEFFGKIIND